MRVRRAASAASVAHVVDGLLTDEVLVRDFRVKRHVSDGLVNGVTISEVDGDVNGDVNGFSAGKRIFFQFILSGGNPYIMNSSCSSGEGERVEEKRLYVNHTAFLLMCYFTVTNCSMYISSSNTSL